LSSIFLITTLLLANYVEETFFFRFLAVLQNMNDIIDRMNQQYFVEFCAQPLKSKRNEIELFIEKKLFFLHVAIQNFASIKKLQLISVKHEKDSINSCIMFSPFNDR
jgi:hypothetical protein